MSGESFQRRVEVLRDTWAERRELRGLAGAHDLASQLRLLSTLHGWAREATTDIGAVYGSELSIGLSPDPSANENPSFTVTVGEHHTLTFLLVERRRAGEASWSVSVSVGSGGPGGSIIAAGPERRNGQWTRARLEDILLSVLGAYERSLTDGAAANGVTRRFRARA